VPAPPRRCWFPCVAAAAYATEGRYEARRPRSR
jgi:hypothetical protein